MFIGLLALVVHICAIYIGAHFAELEYVDIWRCLTVGIVGFFASLLVGLLLSPLVLIPFLNVFFGALVMLLSTVSRPKLCYPAIGGRRGRLPSWSRSSTPCSM